jgi:serine/threonine protein kinase
MELLEGISLASLVAEFGPVPPERAVFLLGGICESLAEAHERGMVHRDVKPANIYTCVLGGKYDFVKVLDFGLVKTLPGVDSAASPTVTGAIAGSPAFLAPEAVRGIIAPSCDIYGLGCVAYWLLTGKLVFEGQTSFEILLAHAQQEPIAPSARTGVLFPAELDHLVLACLVKDPARRPKTVAAVAEELALVPITAPWTPARARSFFEENRALIARAHPAMQRVHELSQNVDTPEKPVPPPETPQEREQRERVQQSLDRLQHHFTKSHIDVRELELRMLRVKKAKTAQEIERVFADLPPLGSTLPSMQSVVPPPEKSKPRSSRSSQSDPPPSLGPHGEMVLRRRGEAAMAMPYPEAMAVHVVSVMSSTQRELVVNDGELYKTVAVMGEATLTVNTSQFVEGQAELRCVAVMGNVTIYVGPGIDVEAVGVGVLGVFEHWGGRVRREGRPKLRITGVAVMGLVKVVAGKD